MFYSRVQTLSCCISLITTGAGEIFLLLNLSYTFRQVSKILLCNFVCVVYIHKCLGNNNFLTKNRGLGPKKISFCLLLIGRWGTGLIETYLYGRVSIISQIGWYLLCGKLSPRVRKVLIRNIYGKRSD